MPYFHNFIDEDMTLRYERKYLVNNELLEPLRERFMPFLQPDLFASQHSFKSEYTVRSIYYDTPNYDALSEKTEGLENRIKLRIRGYNDYTNGDKVFLEIKRKLGNRIAKNRALTQYKRLEESLETGTLMLGGEPISKKMYDDGMRFFYHLKREFQQPVNLVVYDREPYHGKMDAGVRITFDKNIRASLFPTIHDLYSNNILSYIWKDSFILEIKYFDKGMPTWAQSIIQEFGLRHEALSKYAAAFLNNEVSIYNLKTANLL